jgi:hypothetical protein
MRVPFVAASLQGAGSGAVTLLADSPGDRNTNTGNPLGTDHAGVPAVQRIHHDAERPSRVVLPIIPR